MFTTSEMAKVFFTCSGSEANDSQVRMLKYQPYSCRLHLENLYHLEEILKCWVTVWNNSSSRLNMCEN
jgi:acetylornithine/succinyldiaminopimelate/putrescine aminotransferase